MKAGVAIGLLAVGLLSLAPTTASAQWRGRVYVAAAGEPGAVFDFRPCIAVEGSDCGAWLDHTVDSSAVVPLQRATRSADGDSLWVENGALKIRTAGRKPAVFTVRDRRGSVIAVTSAPSGPVAYVLLEPASGGMNWILMIDLNTHSAIASTSFRFRPIGMGALR